MFNRKKRRNAECQDAMAQLGFNIFRDTLDALQAHGPENTIPAALAGVCNGIGTYAALEGIAAEDMPELIAIIQGDVGRFIMHAHGKTGGAIAKVTDLLKT